MYGSHARLDVFFTNGLWMTRGKYDEVVTAVQHNLAAVEEATIQQNPEQAEIVTDHTEAADADSLESF